MENMIETFTKEEQAIFIVALFLLLFAIVMSYAMIQDYRILLIQKQKIMSSNNNSSGAGIGFLGMLTIAFIVLKLTKCIARSWWWVLGP